MLKDIAKLFSDLRNVVTEPVRATIVRRFCRMFIAYLKGREAEPALQAWAAKGQKQFIQDCKITGGFQAVMDDIDVSATELAHFCDRWLSVSQYRRKSDGVWVPFSADMNSVRVTMIEQLQELAAKKFAEEA
jgi:hypothetical protein